MIRSIRAHLVVAAVAMLLNAPALSAQAAPAKLPKRIPVTIVIVDSLPVADAPFVVRRRLDFIPADVIMLTAKSQAADLNDAIQTLLVARLAGGDYPVMAGTLRMRPQRNGQTVPRREFPWVPRVLNDLHAAPQQQIAGVGNVQAVQIWLPRQRPAWSR